MVIVHNSRRNAGRKNCQLGRRSHVLRRGCITFLPGKKCLPNPECKTPALDDCLLYKLLKYNNMRYCQASFQFRLRTGTRSAMQISAGRDPHPVRPEKDQQSSLAEEERLMSSGATVSNFSISPLFPSGTPSVKSRGENLLSNSDSRSAQSQIGSLPSFFAAFANVQLSTSASQPAVVVSVSQKSPTQSVNTTPSSQTAVTHGAELTSSSARNVGAQGVIQTPFGPLPVAKVSSLIAAKDGQENQNRSYLFAASAGGNAADAQNVACNSGLFGLGAAEIFAESGTAGSAPANTLHSSFRRA